VEASPGDRLNAGGGAAAPAAGDDGSGRRTGAILMVLLSGIAIGASALVLDAYIREGGLRMLVAGLLLGVLGLFLSMAAALWSLEPRPWRHRFVPVRYQDELYPRLASVLGAELPPQVTMVTAERILSATWVREALAERIVMGLGLDPAKIAAALDRPMESEYLEDRPAVRRFLQDTRDMGMVAKGTVLTLPRKEFLKAAESALAEAGSL
jgi:hypothetical protein